MKKLMFEKKYFTIKNLQNTFKTPSKAAKSIISQTKNWICLRIGKIKETFL